MNPFRRARLTTLILFAEFVAIALPMIPKFYFDYRHGVKIMETANPGTDALRQPEFASELHQKKIAWLERLVPSNLLMGGAILVLTHLFFQTIVVKKIYRLKSEARKLGAKQLDTSFKWEEGGEINELGMALEDARKTLRQLLGDLKTSNVEFKLLASGLESQVSEHTRQLTEKSRLASLGEMAAGLAHEINNPLTVIAGKAAKLRRVAVSKGDGPNSDLKDLATIETTVERIAKIIRGLRTFSRDGSLNDFEEANLKGILEETLEMVRSRFAAHSIELSIGEMPADLRLECRPIQLGQVMLNLLNNAHDAVQEFPERWVKVVVEANDDTVKICVMDSCLGIPESLREKLMQPFFTTKPVGEGTGLGLSISRGIILSHGGTLTIDSTCPNTCFVISLPRKQVQRRSLT